MKNTILSQEEILVLLERARQTDVAISKQAKNEIIQSNMRLITSIAKKFCKKKNNLDDLIQEGMLGVLNAIEKYEADKGTKFSTYAAIWIRQRIGMWCNSKQRIVRLPAHAEGVNRKINALTEKHKAKTGKRISREDIAKQISDSSAIIDATIRAAVPILSMDSPVGEGTMTLGDKLSCNDMTPSEILERKEMMAIAKNVYMQLPEREKQIIKLRFGLEDLWGL